MVSLPVLNPRTILNNGFDTYRLMDKHNDMRAMVSEMTFSEEQPSFYLLNVGETHYPYALPDEPPEQWPRISGVHGVFKHLDDQVVGGKLLRKSERDLRQAEAGRAPQAADRSREISGQRGRGAVRHSFPRTLTSRSPRTTGNCSAKTAISDTVPSCTRRCSKSRSSKASCDDRLPSPISVRAPASLFSARF